MACGGSTDEMVAFAKMLLNGSFLSAVSITETCELENRLDKRDFLPSPDSHDPGTGHLSFSARKHL
jgi:hypothetical protein